MSAIEACRPSAPCGACNHCAGTQTRRPTSWLPVDLDAAIAGRETDPPTLLQRDDGEHLLYPGRVHWFQGESESLKSFAAQLACTQVLRAARRALYIDFEDDELGVVSRLLALGATECDIRPWFTYIAPDEPLRASHGAFTPAMVDFEDTIDQHRPDLAVVDGVTEAMAMESMNLLDNSDIAEWMRLVPRKLANTGAAVVVIDHVTKNRENRGRYAIGGQHKLAGIDGAAYTFECTRPLSRSISDPVTGTATMSVSKDRPGYVRARARDKVVGTLELTAYPDGGITGSITSPSRLSTAPDPRLRAEILHLLKTYEGASKSHIESTLVGNAAVIRAATKWLVDNEQVDVRREGAAHRHYITDDGITWLAENEDEDT